MTLKLNDNSIDEQIPNMSNQYSTNKRSVTSFMNESKTPNEDIIQIYNSEQKDHLNDTQGSAAEQN